MTDSTTVIFGVAAVPAIAGLVTYLKKLGMPSKFAPLAAVGIGLVAGVIEFAKTATGLPVEQTIIEGAIVGVGQGLSASGAYDGSGKLASFALGLFSKNPPAPTKTLISSGPALVTPVEPPK